jgi:hypothetical protein
MGAKFVRRARANAAMLGDGNVQSRIDPDLATAIRVASPLTIPTGFTGNDIVEPQVRYFPTGCPVGMDGKKYVMYGCPYPSSDATKENPSLWVSDDGNTWSVPSGVTNPIYPVNVGGGGYGNNSDGDLILGIDNVWYAIWNQFGPLSTWKIRVGSSIDGVNWSAPTDAVSTAIGTSRPTSPTILYDPTLGLYVMYALDVVNPAIQLPLMRYTATNPAGPWTLTTAPTFPWPQAGRGAWHINTYLVGEQHVLLIDDTPVTGSGPGHLYLAVSDDHGVTWAVGQRPLMQQGLNGATKWDSGGYYRSAMVPRMRGDQFTFDLFYGATGPVGPGQWAIGRSTVTFDRRRHGSSIAAKVAPGLGMYYTSPGTGVSTAAVAASDQRVCPIYFDRSVTLDRIGIECTAVGDAAAYYRLGIYADNGDGCPGVLIADFGPTAAMSAIGWYELPISQPLPPGMYWLSGVPQNVTTTPPTVRIHTAGSGTPSVGSTVPLTLSQNVPLGWRSSGAGGAFGPTFATVPTISGTAPRVLIRIL